MELNNGYQNLYLNGLDISVGGSLEGLKEQIRDILPNKIVIVSGVVVGSDKKLPIGCEIRKYITYTEEPEDWDEEEQGEFIPEEVYNLEIKNLYGYDLTIVDNVVSSTATQNATYEGVEALIEGGTIDNAKPIYYHGLEFIHSTGRNALFYAHVLSNSDSPIDSFQKFFEWITSFPSSVFVVGTGFLTIENVQYQLYALYKRPNENKINIIYFTGTDYQLLYDVDLSDYFENISDGLNKIN